LFGVLFGHRKLFPRISPNKSWEGFFGGVCCAIGTGALLSLWQEGSWIMWAGAGGVIALSGVVGDLVESMMKRSVQIKDSGRIMPGHGGFLDRFDALFLAVPFVYTYFALWQWMQG
ncbi:MAG: phosphatidate cytidylyltransferase, partial [Alistipes sp.]|nr:phosphatidate cytidylyltransferase [Alistipes sp.]